MSLKRGYDVNDDPGKQRYIDRRTSYDSTRRNSFDRPSSYREKEPCRKCGYRLNREDLYRGFCSWCSPDHPNHRSNGNGRRYEEMDSANVHSNIEYQDDFHHRSRRRSFSRDYDREDYYNDDHHLDDRRNLFDEKYHRHQLSRHQYDADDPSRRFRRSRSSSPASRNRHRYCKSKYPPAFEDSGTQDYIFHPTTGYFFEDISQFYYDPKSKLYYSSEKKVYYEYNKETKRFQELDSSTGLTKMPMVTTKSFSELDSGVDIITQALKGDTKPLTIDKPKISICIKQKSIPNTQKKSHENKIKTPPATSLDLKQSKVVKEREADLEKWSQRIKERQNSNDDGTTQVPIRMSSPGLDPVVRQMERTKSGKAVCLICRRKFTTDEQWQRHVDLSMLHKYHLSKTKGGTSGAEKYLDRAQQRRSMHKSEETVVPTFDSSLMIEAPNLNQARKVDLTEIVRPEDNLGSSNIGNQMLQKLGWSGGTLGPSSSSGEASKDQINKNLRNDWDRIEKLASSNK